MPITVKIDVDIDSDIRTAVNVDRSFQPINDYAGFFHQGDQTIQVRVYDNQADVDITALVPTPGTNLILVISEGDDPDKPALVISSSVAITSVEGGSDNVATFTINTATVEMQAFLQDLISKDVKVELIDNTGLPETIASWTSKAINQGFNPALGLPVYTNVKHKISILPDRAPTVDDDETAGYSRGSIWKYFNVGDEVNGETYMLGFSGEGAAVWKLIPAELTLQDVLDFGNTSTNDIILTGAAKVVAAEFEVSGGSVKFGDRLIQKAFGSNLQVNDVIAVTKALGVKVPLSSAGTAEPKIPVIGAEQTIIAQAIDANVFQGISLDTGLFTADSDGILSRLTYKIQDADKPFKVKITAKKGDDFFELLGTSEDPYLRFTSTAGVNNIDLSSPIPIENGVEYTSIIETEDETPCTLLGDESGAAYSYSFGDVAESDFAIFLSVVIQDNREELLNQYIDDEDVNLRATTSKVPTYVEYSVDGIVPTFATVDIKVAGKYRLELSWLAAWQGNTNRSANFIPAVDDVSILPSSAASINLEFPDDGNILPISFYKKNIDLSVGNHTISLKYAVDSGGGTRTLSIHKFEYSLTRISE